LEGQKKAELLLHHKQTDQTHFILGFRAHDMFNEKRYALGLLSSILGGNMSSRLFSEIRERRGLAYYIRSGVSSYTDSGILSVRAGVNNAKILEAIKATLSVISEVKTKGVTEEELQKAKDNVKGGLVLSFEHSDNVASHYADSLTFYNKVLTPEEELSKIYNVSMDDIKAVASEILLNSRLNLALIGPHKDKEVFNKILTMQ